MSLTNGTKIKGVPDDGCAKCMFSCGTCCTSWTAVLKIEGDHLIQRDGVWYFIGGKNPATPPCLQGKEFMHWEIIGGGAPPMANATMER